MGVQKSLFTNICADMGGFYISDAADACESDDIPHR